MKNCPECQAPVDGLKCPSCGFTDTTDGIVHDPRRHLCADVMRGLRCSKVASFSHSTTGSGPWLCWDHFAPNATRYADGVRQGPPGGFQTLKTVLRRVDPEAAAERAAIAADGAPL